MAIQLGDTAGDGRVRPELAPAGAVRANAAARAARAIPRQLAGLRLHAEFVPPVEVEDEPERHFHVEVIHRKPSNAFDFAPPLLTPPAAEVAPRRWSALLPWALGCSLLLPPVGAVLAIITLVRTVDGRVRGRGHAVAALGLAITMSLFAPLVGVLSYNNYKDQQNAEIVAADLMAARRAVLGYQQQYHRLPQNLGSAGFVPEQTRDISYGLTSAGELCLAGRGPRDHVLLYVGESGSISPHGC